MHHVDSLIIHCIDYRFQEFAAQWIKENIGSADRVVLAGASKSVLDEDTQATLFKQLAIALRLHAIKTVHIIDHFDCGAYGGSNAQTDEVAEKVMHQEKLYQAARLITQQFPDLQVKTYIMNAKKVMTM